MHTLRREPLPYVSRAELAAELSILETSVDEMVRRGVLPRPSTQTPAGPFWSWRLVERALALFEPSQRDDRLYERHV
jgi:hypothetical protein